jgi:hypothetical protein
MNVSGQLNPATHSKQITNSVYVHTASGGQMGGRGTVPSTTDIAPSRWNRLADGLHTASGGQMGGRGAPPSTRDIVPLSWNGLADELHTVSGGQRGGRGDASAITERAPQANKNSVDKTILAKVLFMSFSPFALKPP